MCVYVCVVIDWSMSAINVVSIVFNPSQKLPIILHAWYAYLCVSTLCIVFAFRFLSVLSAMCARRCSTICSAHTHSHTRKPGVRHYTEIGMIFVFTAFIV